MRVSGDHNERKVRQVFKSPIVLELLAQLRSSSPGCGRLSHPTSSSTRCYHLVSAVNAQGLWSEFGPCMKVTTCARSCGPWKARDSVRRDRWRAKKAWKIAVTQTWATLWLQLWSGTDPRLWMWYKIPLHRLAGKWSKAVEGDGCLQKWSGNKNLCQVLPARMETNVEFTRHSANCCPHVNVDHTQNTHQMLTYTHFKLETHRVAHTGTQSCHWHFLQVKAGI